MRILAGPWRRGWTVRSLPALRAQPGVDVLSFSYEPGADILYGGGSGSFGELARQFPTGWEPDLVLLWMPEDHGVPLGIEDCPYPVVACVGDWNLGFETMRSMAGAFDYIFTDRGGVDVFQRAGFERVEHAKLYGFHPPLHRRLTKIERRYDIGMVGNVNPEVQRGRSSWLARLAALNGELRVRVQAGLFNEDYVRAVNETTMTFNRSVRGEMNMRAYEAPACGSLLFLEEENLEVRDVYEDGVHCVLYNEENFEELVRYYATHDIERERIVEAGHARVQDFSYERQFKRLLDRIRELGIAGRPPGRRHFLELSAAGQHRARAVHLSMSIAPGSWGEAYGEIQQARREDPRDAHALSDFGALRVLTAPKQGQPQIDAIREAMEAFRRAAGEDPSHSVALANHAEMLAAVGDHAAAERAFSDALAAVNDCQDAFVLGCLQLPIAYDRLHVERQGVATQLIGDVSAYLEAMRGLYRWYLWDRLGGLRARRRDWLQAVDAYQHACQERPFGATHFRMARALVALGRTDEAVEELQVALIDEPFHFEARDLLTRMQLERGDLEACRALCEETLQVGEVCSTFTEVVPVFQARLAQCTRVLAPA